MGVTERGGVRASIAALAGLLPLLHAAPASADPIDSAGGGIFLGYAFGERGGFEWGIEGFATHWLEKHDDCEGSEPARHGVGPLLRLAAVKTSRLELTLAGHGGGDLLGLRPFFSIDGELGASLFWEKNHELRVAPHTGVTFESLIFNLYFRQQWVEPSASVGGGARFLPTFGLPALCADGRPYRGASGRARIATVRRAQAFERRCPQALLWARRAADECASVPAFMQLARELEQLGAPTALVQRALHAAREELGHTFEAARLAMLFGGAEVTPQLPAFQARPSLPRPLALARLVTESWVDGMLNEGRAAAVAEAESAAARAPEEAQVSRLIAREEAGHAALAFDVIRWALTQAPELASLLRAQRHVAASGFGATSLAPDHVWELARHSTARAAEQLSNLVA